MKLAASNIGWDRENDDVVFAAMERQGFNGLEIAPTKYFPEDPYSHAKSMREIADNILWTHGFTICSMQSIWYGRTEKVFGTDKEREVLVDHTRRAMDFAAEIGCKNLVFGCPKNRSVPEDMPREKFVEIARDFFGKLGFYAAKIGVVLSLEANPPIYGTNFMNTTDYVLESVRKMYMPGLRVNLDLGTMIENKETVEILNSPEGAFINHVHFSEPHMKPLEKRELHTDVIKTLMAQGYEGWFSIEIGGQNSVQSIIDSIEYVGRIGQYI